MNRHSARYYAAPPSLPPPVPEMRRISAILPMHIVVKPLERSGALEENAESLGAAEGLVVARGLRARLTLRATSAASHQANGEVSTEAVLLESGATFPISRRSVPRAARPDPAVRIQLRNGSGEPLTREILLGRLDHGPYEISPPCFAEFDAGAWIEGGGDAAGSTGGPSFAGRLVFPTGITARISYGAHPHGHSPAGAPDAEVDVEIMPPGWTARFPLRPVGRGATDSSWFWLAFVDGIGRSASPREYLIGRALERCN